MCTLKRKGDLSEHWETFFTVVEMSTEEGGSSVFVFGGIPKLSRHDLMQLAVGGLA